MGRQDGDKLTALIIGFAGVTIGWFALEAVAPNFADSLGDLSAWFYGPASLVVWGFISVVALFALRRSGGGAADEEDEPNPTKNTSDRNVEQPDRLALRLRTEAARQLERDKISALTSGFACTVTAWLIALSYFPQNWLDAIGGQPPWLYSLVSMVFWTIVAIGSYRLIRRNRAIMQTDHGRAV